MLLKVYFLFLENYDWLLWFVNGEFGVFGVLDVSWFFVMIALVSLFWIIFFLLLSCFFKYVSFRVSLFFLFLGGV